MTYEMIMVDLDNQSLLLLLFCTPKPHQALFFFFLSSKVFNGNIIICNDLLYVCVYIFIIIIIIVGSISSYLSLMFRFLFYFCLCANQNGICWNVLFRISRFPNIVSLCIYFPKLLIHSTHVFVCVLTVHSISLSFCSLLFVVALVVMIAPMAVQLSVRVRTKASQRTETTSTNVPLFYYHNTSSAVPQTCMNCLIIIIIINDMYCSAIHVRLAKCMFHWSMSLSAQLQLQTGCFSVYIQPGKMCRPIKVCWQLWCGMGW